MTEERRRKVIYFEARRTSTDWMFTLLSDIYHTYSLVEEYSILLLGLDDAGKSTLLESLKLHFPTSAQSRTESQLSQEVVDRVRPTVGQSRSLLSIQKTRFQVWDLGGQVTLRELWARYLDDAHIIVYVVDASHPERLEESKGALTSLVKTYGTRARESTEHGEEQAGVEEEEAHEQGLPVPILIIANKTDVDGSMEVAQVKEALNSLVEVIGPIEGGVLGTSALRGTGVSEVGAWVHKRAVRNKDARPPLYR